MTLVLKVRYIDLVEKTIKVFLSYAAEDRQCAEELWKNLSVALKTQHLYSFELWSFGKQLLVGEDFHSEIQKAISDAEIGIFALSGDFLCSKYIAKYELPHFLLPGNKKRIVPIMLKPISATADLRGLEEKQIFRFNDPYRAKSNGSLKQPMQREYWANSLADELHELVKRYSIGE